MSAKQPNGQKSEWKRSREARANPLSGKQKTRRKAPGSTELEICKNGSGGERFDPLRQP